MVLPIGESSLYWFQKKGEEDDEPIVIANDHSFLRSLYRSCHEFSSLLRQSMVNPLHELRALSRNYENSFASQIKMVTRINQLNAHYAPLKLERKLKKMREYR
jgi:hypothetical protein